mmetsp:Transcript_3103/g.6600  ORF Transcript_3103/g.6600 Transcript_3103/m.6600 type:complete len:247 (+) Transcript_3103:3-743(+)
MEGLNMGLEKPQIRALIDRIDTSGDGEIDFMELKRRYGAVASDKRPVRHVAGAVTTDSSMRNWRVDLVARRDAMLQHCRGADPRAQGRITKAEFSRLLMAKLGMDDDDVLRVLQGAEVDKLVDGGLVFYEEIAAELKRHATPPRRLGEEELPRSQAIGRTDFHLRELVRVKYDTIRNAFLAFDIGQRGEITKVEFREALSKLGSQLPGDTASKLTKLAKFDVSGFIDYNAFLADLGGPQFEGRKGY